MTEHARLAALASYDILDTSPERDFDDVAALASEICGTPIAVVNLIADDRQFFKAEVGLGVRSTPLESSFCAKAILEEDFLVVPDATRDPRFNCNPLVTGEPNLRFYAGALLKTDEGHAIGTVCVLGFEPRALTGLQERTLRLLARQVMKQLELRKALRAQAASVARLEDSDARSRLAQQAGRIGTFEVDIASGQMTVSPEFCQLFGVPIAETLPAEFLEGLVIPEDRGVHSEPASRADGTADLDVEYRIRRPDDGRLRWIARRAQFLRDPAGKTGRMIGTVHDVTQRKTLQVQQAALLELGDRLRAATSSEEVVGAAAEILGRTLAASRAGYSRVDMRSDLFEVRRDWTAPGAASLNGRHGLSMFQDTIARLSKGETIAVANIRSAPWLAGDVPSYDGIGTQAQIKVPLVEKGDLVGLLYAHQAQPRTWTTDEVDFAHGVADRAYAALAKVQAESDQAILNQELSHRLKNTLAMVQAIAAQTLRGVTEKEAVAAFNKRIHAIAAAHDVLLQQSWSAARIDAVVRAVLGTFDMDDRFDVSGPDINLGPRATLSLSMLLHELTTNAVKYGALSADGGRVSVHWSLAGQNGSAEIVLDWSESGGPPTRAPDRKGFGSRLIGMGLVGTGGSELRYPPRGFEAEFRAPLAQMQQS